MKNSKNFISMVEKPNSKNKNKVRGFTIIELMTVVFIMITLSSLVLINYRSAGSSQALNRSAQKLAFYIRKAQTMALAGVNFSQSDPNRRCGYGVHFRIDIPEDNQIFGVRNCGSANYSGGDPMIEQIEFENNVFVQSLTPTNNILGNQILTLVFAPPHPDTFINGNTSDTLATITLSLTSDTSQTKTISVTNKGQVNIQ